MPGAADRGLSARAGAHPSSFTHRRPGGIHEFQAGTFYRPIPASYLDTLVSESSKLPAYEGTGHGIHAEQPHPFVHDLQRFLGK